MTREEKCELAIERGYYYDKLTGFIYNKTNNMSSSINKGGYITLGITINKTSNTIYGHHFAWFYVHKTCSGTIDHINGNKLDNRIINLRIVTNQENHFNRTKAKGYCLNKNNNNWVARIKLDYKLIHIGTFSTEIEARNAYLKAKEIYHKIKI